MAVFVNTNVSSLNGRRYLDNVQNQLTTTYQRLSSGMRINSAKDDAAGLQISDRLTTQINGLNQGNRNANDGIALLQTIDGAVEEITGSLQRARTLLVQAANGTNTATDLKALETEIGTMLLHGAAIATDTTFAGKKILEGHMKNNDDIYESVANGKNFDPGIMRLQVGANSGDEIVATIKSFFIPEIVNGTQVDYNGKKQSIADISDGAFVIDQGQDNRADGMSVKIATHADARNALAAIDFVIAEVDSRRAEVGAYMNRLESSIRNQSNVAANEADARSRIRDADFAEESANLSQQSIIQQAAASMLMQANTRPQLGLSLLG